MSAKKKRLIALCIGAVLLIWYFFPRSFQSAMPQNFNPEEMLGVDVILAEVVGTGKEGFSFTISAEDPAYQALTDLLDSKRYFPLLPTAGMNGWDAALEYIVLLAFYNDNGSYFMQFSGDQAIRFYTMDSNRYFHTIDSKAFQQDVLDLLLNLETEQETEE